MERAKADGKAKRWDKEFRHVDPVLRDAHPSDIIIPIMGPTGVGKSTFINALCGSAVATVGHRLQSRTSALQPFTILVPHGVLKGRRLVVVDTPGFDDTYLDDSEILRRIATWLAMSYKCEMKLAGVVYLHDISQCRFLGTVSKNLHMFRKLCGDNVLSSIILGTTKWGQVDHETEKKREKELERVHWKDMLENSATMHRFLDDHDSAWKIINCLLETQGGGALHVQQELVDLGKLIPDTDAGKLLRYKLEEALRLIRTSGSLSQEGTSGKDADKQIVTQEEIQKILQSLQYLKLSFSRRIKIFLGIA